MNKLGKIAPIIVIVASLGSLFFAFKLSSQKKDLKEQNTTLASGKQQAEKERDSARKDLQETKTALARTTDDLSAASANLQAAQEKAQKAEGLKAQLDDKTKELVQAKTELGSAQETLKKIQEITASDDFKNVDQVRERLMAQADENKILGRQLMIMRDENKLLKGQVSELSTTPVNVRGQVAAVQDSWGFVVLDIGRSQHVTTNAQFLVYRDSKMIGKVQVLSVGATTSVAEVLPEYQRGTPRVGDLVIH
jgi:myosin heavy subunit